MSPSWSASLYCARAPAGERPQQAAEKRSREMPRYLISFDDGAMDHIPDKEGPAVGEAAHAVIREAQDAGVWVFAGGVYPHDEVNPKVVAPDGAVVERTENK